MPENKESIAGRFFDGTSSLSKTIRKKEAGPKSDLTSSVSNVAQTLKDKNTVNGNYKNAVEAIQKKPALLKLVDNPFRLISMGFDGILSDPPKGIGIISFLYTLGARLKRSFPSEKHQAEGKNLSRSFHSDGNKSNQVPSKHLSKQTFMSNFTSRTNSSRKVDQEHSSKRGMGSRR